MSSSNSSSAAGQSSSPSSNSSNANHSPPNRGIVVARKKKQREALGEKISQMRIPLAPLVQLTTGAIHAAFPRTLLHFWLLTDQQLDSLAEFYHQAYICKLTWQYPCPIPWSNGATLETKRRRFGRFIGLRGCESPTTASDGMMHSWTLTEEEMLEEARRARIEEEELDRKLYLR